MTPECPRGLRFVIDKLLAKRPERRFADGAALRDALDREGAVYQQVQTEGGRRRLPLPARMALLTTAITAAVLCVSIGVVLDRQYKAMERVALTSGSSIATFVASNAALPAAENMVLPPELRDWLPTQAFVATAASDPNVTQMLVVDRDGVIQAASDPDIVGGRYIAPSGRPIASDRSDVSVTNMRTADGTRNFRFTRPIQYAGRDVGIVEVSIRRTELDAAASLTRAMLIGLGLLTLVLVAGLTVAAAKFVLRPLGRLREALTDAARGNLEFRISHQRRDEFGDLFEAFNTLAFSAQKRLEAGGGAAQAYLNATAVTTPAVNDEAGVRKGAAQWSR